MKPFSLKQLVSSLLAGFIATLVHISLMEIKHRLGVLPSFEPQVYFQEIFSPLFALSGSSPLWKYLPDINGGLLLGFLFGRLFIYLPGSRFTSKGMIFGLGAWLLLGLVVFPLGGLGVFAYAAGLGYLPAFLMLMMLMIYSVTMSFVYSRLV
jgi:hypothetical protein